LAILEREAMVVRLHSLKFAGVHGNRWTVRLDIVFLQLNV
jgi:hypothetical protein